MIKLGIIDKDGSPTGKPPEVTREAIREPGGKVRIVTKTYAALVVYGQPFAHVCKDALTADPLLEAGLNAGYMGWEFYKRLHFVKDFKIFPKHVFLMGDYETATDFIEHDFSYEICSIYLKQAGLTSPYIHNYLRLLCSPRQIVDIKNNAKPQHVLNTLRGILMGDPGSKVVLTILTRLTYQQVYNEKQDGYLARYLPSAIYPITYEDAVRIPFATAGDDQIFIGKKSLLNRFTLLGPLYSLKPSTDKWRINKHAAMFCEQVIMRGNFDRWDPQNDPNSALLDNIKSRLLSKHRKIQPHEVDQDSNPVFGKALQLFDKILSWCRFSSQETIETIRSVFLRNFHQYLPHRFARFLPHQWGGLQINDFDINEIPKAIQSLIRIREYNNQNDPRFDGASVLIANFVLQSYCQKTLSSRGLRIKERMDDIPFLMSGAAEFAVPLQSLIDDEMRKHPQGSSSQKWRPHWKQKQWISYFSEYFTLSDCMRNNQCSFWYDYLTLPDLTEIERGYKNLRHVARLSELQKLMRESELLDENDDPLPPVSQNFPDEPGELFSDIMMVQKVMDILYESPNVVLAEGETEPENTWNGEFFMPLPKRVLNQSDIFWKDENEPVTKDTP